MLHERVDNLRVRENACAHQRRDHLTLVHFWAGVCPRLDQHQRNLRVVTLTTRECQRTESIHNAYELYEKSKKFIKKRLVGLKTKLMEYPTDPIYNYAKCGRPRMGDRLMRGARTLNPFETVTVISTPSSIRRRTRSGRLAMMAQ